MPPVDAWAWAFGWTILIEAPIVVAALRLPTPWRTRLRHAIPIALSLQAITHPALWYLAPRFDPYPLWLVTMEAVVVIVEAWVLALFLRWGHRRASGEIGGGLAAFVTATSLVANGTSAVIGLGLV